MKYWKIKNNNVVLIKDKIIYLGVVKSELFSKFTRELENDIIPKNLFSIPFSYLKRIENQEGSNKIKIFYGNDSEEEITTKNKETKEDIFNYLKEEVPKMRYVSETPSFIKYNKRLLFALLFTLIIFAWSFYYANEIEKGTQFELKGTPGVFSIIYFIGMLGKLKVISLFTFLISLIVLFIFKRNKTKSETEELIRF